MPVSKDQLLLPKQLNDYLDKVHRMSVRGLPTRRNFNDFTYAEKRKKLLSTCATIICLLRNNQRHAISYILSEHNEIKSIKTTKHYIEAAFRFLIDNKLIKRTRWYQHKTYDGNNHVLTRTCKQYYENETTFYLDFKVIDHLISRTQVIQTPDDLSRICKLKDEYFENMNYHTEWRKILPKGNETNEFIHALQHLEKNRYIFNRLKAITLDKWEKHHPFWIPASRFDTRYYPLITGRLQSKPHLYIGKDLLKYLRPVEDPNLEKGSMISLDFSQQELRLLGYHSKDSILFNLCKKPDSVFDELLNRINYTDLKTYEKLAIYSYIYGSTGRAIFEKMTADYNKELKELSEWTPRYEYMQLTGDFFKKAVGFIKALEHLLPEVKSYQKSITDEYKNTNMITAPGGITRYFDPNDMIREKIQPDGSVKTTRNHNIFRQTALSHFIQGAGAYLTRLIVTESKHLKYSRLFLPVHDGFIYYVKDRLNTQRAEKEATDMMLDCANKVAPDVLMPVKLEWQV